MSNKYFTKKEILDLPEAAFPIFTLSDNIRSLFSFLIKKREKGNYNHFMVAHRKGFFASQDMTFREVPMENYLEGNHRLKFYTNPKWDQQAKYTIISAIKRDLQLPWYTRIYDPLAIVGQLFGINWLQIPGIDICSDYGKYFKLVDNKFDLKYPSPPDINKYLEKRKAYKCLGRYVPD